MKHLIFALSLAFSFSSFASTWQLESSSVSYHVVHPLHKIDATSTGSKGKGVCEKDICDFLIASPVASFDSQNTSRDTHVLQVVGGGLHPLVSVRIHIKTASYTAHTPMTAEIEMNGTKVTRDIVAAITKTENSATAKGKINLKLTDFNIELPSLLSVSVKDDFVVDFESRWNYK